MRTLLLISGLCANGAWADVPRVAVDIAPVHSIVAAIMGDLGQPDLIVPPTASPHGYSLRPSEARALDGADMVIWMGHNLSPWLEGPIESLAGDADVIELLARPETHLLAVRDGVTFEAGDHDHDHGHAEEAAHDEEHDHAKEHGDAHADHEEHADHDDHEEHAEHDDHEEHEEHAKHDEEHADDGDHKDHADHGDHDDHEEHADHDDHAAHADDVEHAAHNDGHGHDEDHAGDHGDAHVGAHDGPIDPHAWLDPVNARIWASFIVDELAAMDPENADTYFDNAAAFISEINSLQAKLDASLAPLRGRPFVVFHDAYHYFEHRFDIEAVGAVSATDAVAPSAARVSELRADLVQYNAVCALTEPQFNPAILDVLGEVKLGTLDPLGATLDVGPNLYGQVLENMATSLAKCLE